MNHAPTSLMVLGARRQQRCRKWRFYRTRCQRMTLLSNATAVIPTVGWSRLQQVKRFIILVMSDNTGKKLPNVLDFVSYHTTSTSYRIVQYWSSRLWTQSSSFLLSLQNQKLRLLDSDHWWLLELCCCVVVSLCAACSCGNPSPDEFAIPFRNTKTIPGDPSRQVGCNQILFRLLQSLQSVGTQISKACKGQPWLSLARAHCLCTNSPDAQ